jgi:hypothetical protein
MSGNFRGLGVVLSGFVLTGLVGCKKLAGFDMSGGTATPGVASAVTAASATSVTDREAEADSALSEKLNQYIECLNGMSETIVRSHDRYVDWADEKKGPNMNRASTGLYDIGNADSCSAALAKAKAMPPALPNLDPVVAAYQQATATLLPLNQEAYKYYDQGNYKDDKLAKGKAMHQPLLAAFAKFQDASKALEESVGKLNDELAQRRMARLAKDPTRHLAYLVEKTEVDAKALVRASHVQTLKQLDLASYSALVDRCEKTFAELDAYLSAHKDEADQVNGIDRFDKEALEFGKEAKELMRRKRDNKDFARESENSEGHPAHVVEIYNRFIQAANSVRFKT